LHRHLVEQGGHSLQCDPFCFYTDWCGWGDCRGGAWHVIFAVTLPGHAHIAWHVILAVALPGHAHIAWRVFHTELATDGLQLQVVVAHISLL
jgi:hypothetical protein